MGPGLRIVVPVVQSFQKVDMRVKAVDVPDQEAMTGDNISTTINAVIYYKIAEAKRAILEVEHYNYAISQLAQTTMRNVVGEVELDELLANRDKVSLKIKEIVTNVPSPFALNLILQGYSDILKMEDRQDFLKRMHQMVKAKIGLKKK